MFERFRKKPSENPPLLESEQERSFLLRLWDLCFNTIAGFIKDECYLKASALTFYSLLSIVPVIAVLLGIAKGFGFEKDLKMDITQNFEQQREAVEIMLQIAYSWLQNVKSGVITGFGVLLLFWSVIGLLNNIESALNGIWKTKYSRSYTRKIIDYLALIIISPFFLVTLSSLNVYITLHLSNTPQNAIIDVFSHFIRILLKLSPFFLSWVLFTFVYLFMPNTKVYFRTAVIAGIIAGTAFQVWQWIYIKFQVGAASYGAIYGSFAALPLFLIWLQVSWLILLAGAELAYQMENNLFVPNRKSQKLTAKSIALYITYKCIEAFSKSLPPLTDRDLTKEMGLSLSEVHNVLDILQKDRILSLVSVNQKMLGYQPAKAVKLITMQSVCEAIDKSYELKGYVADSEEMIKIQDYLRKVDQTLKDSKFDEPVYPLT